MGQDSAPRPEDRGIDIAIRLAALLLVALAVALLLTGCAKAQERRDAREATQTAQEAASPPAATTDAPPAVPQQTAPAANGSAGCGAAAQTGSSVQGIESDGVQRSYRLYVPAGYNANTPAPLVLNYHGYGSNALEQERYSEYPEAADKYGFIVATPDGTSSPQEWFIYGPIEQGYVDDFAFSERLIDQLSATLCIDEDRIYATGISNGGGMTSLVGCKLNDRVAAIAPVAGSPYAEGQCSGAGPLPIIAFHGTEDRLVPFEPVPDTGRPDLFRFGIRNNMREWAQHNGCNLTLQSQRIAEDVVLESYGGCKDGADVHLYIVEGGGHTWPGASRNLPALGVTTRSIRATELSWLFFADHPK